MSVKTSLGFAVFVLLLSFAAPVGAQELRRAGFVGVRAGQLTDEERARLHFAGEGVVVFGLVDGGSAKEAGLQADDVITEVNGHRIKDTDDFVTTVTRLRAGDGVTIHFVRGGAKRNAATKQKPRLG
ncbi:MAG TPA: PDZ domain-containing protein [Pyrinomonadaceae bacterium]|nr:PDZ domain-containing protein [Pyrinomonadaceae bacterium]